QGLSFGAGLVLMAIVWRIDYSRLRELRYGLYGMLLASILAVLALGATAKGAQRAIQLPFFSFQGSELGKVLLVTTLAAVVVERSRNIGQRETTALVMLLALVPAFFVIAQPDLGSGLVYIVIALAVPSLPVPSW